MLIALTETHLTSGVKDAEVNIRSYTPFRTDRESRNDGNVMLYITNYLSLHRKQILSFSNGEVELIAVHLKPMDIIVVNCYHPPQCTLQNFKTAIEHISRLIDNLHRPMPDIILCGDFNFPFIQWPEGSTSGATLED